MQAICAEMTPLRKSRPPFVRASGQTSVTIPANPTTRPSTRRVVSRSPSGMQASRPTIQNGHIATSTAVSPLGTVCSAQTTAPLPKPRSSTPSSASAGQDRREGSVAPPALSIASSRAPAVIQRNAAIESGGMVSRRSGWPGTWCPTARRRQSTRRRRARRPRRRRPARSRARRLPTPAPECRPTSSVTNCSPGPRTG